MAINESSSGSTLFEGDPVHATGGANDCVEYERDLVDAGR